MPNWIFSQLLDEQISRLTQSFKISNEIFKREGTNLIHPGEFGIYRETICKEFLSYFIPRSLDISTGFIITSTNEVSTQCDIVIYDRSYTPFIQQGDKQRFFPIEAVVAVGEIKSNVRKGDLKNALNNLSRTKAMRAKLENPKIIRSSGKRNTDKYSTQLNKGDQILTFLICNKLDFAKANFNIPELYENTPQANWHNMILSLEEGIYLYAIADQHKHLVPDHLKDKEGKTELFYHPELITIPLENLFMEKDRKESHVRAFASLFNQGISSTTVLSVDIVKYIGEYFD